MIINLDILLIEDNPDDAALIELELQKSGMDPQIKRVESGDALQAALDAQKWDVIISDYNLPGFDGLSALEILRESGLEIPFILVSGTVGEEFAVEAVLAGANDYVMKDNLKRVPVAVQREIKNQTIKDEKKQSDKKVRESLKEKEVLLKEIHHRVKNNLAVISALLTLQAEHVEDEKSRILFRESIGRIKSMALIHEKLYQTEMLASVAMDEYLRELVSTIEESYPSDDVVIALHVDTDESRLDITQAIPCGLIVNELMSNVYKHAFKGRKEGNVYVKQQSEKGDKRYKLEVRDDGVGLPGDANSFENGSLGFTIIRGLASQLKADLGIRSDPGLCVSLEFDV